MSKEENLKVYSSIFFTIAKYNSILFYFYVISIKYDILKSYLLDIPEDYVDSSKAHKSQKRQRQK